MSQQLIIGVDMAADSFTWTPYQVSEKTYGVATTHENRPKGFDQVRCWIRKQKVSPNEVVFCLENTGVYTEKFCYWMISYGYRLAVEAPLKVKRAFKTTVEKTDALDSRQIAEYALRFLDELHFWTPPKEILEHLRVLLSTREQYVVESTGHQNTLHQLKRKQIRIRLAESSIEKTIEYLRQRIKEIDDEVSNKIKKDPHVGPIHALITSVPGAGTLLASQLIVMTRAFEKLVKPQRLAGHLGIAPLKNQSGRTLNKPPRSRGYGPGTMRKLLYLAAMSMRTHNEQYRHYFLRKVESGKPKRLVLNNIENKMLRVICAVVNSKTPFINNYKSVHPMFLKFA